MQFHPILKREGTWGIEQMEEKGRFMVKSAISIYIPQCGR
jgi:hypothetical protein